MGSPPSPKIADITFHELELKILELQSENILFWVRFRDDIFMLFNGTQHDLNLWVKYINNLHPTFKFSFEISPTEITYLDLEIFKGLIH